MSILLNNQRYVSTTYRDAFYLSGHYVQLHKVIDVKINSYSQKR